MTATSVSSGIEEISWVNQLSLGGGFDTLSSMAHLSCLRLGEQELHETSPGQKTDFALRVIENSASLARSLNVSAQGSANYGVYKADAKANFAAEQACNSSSLFLVASVTVEDRTEQYSSASLQTLKLTPESEELINRNPWDFQQRYGTHFVLGRVLGGELYCVVEIKTASEEEKGTLAASVRGEGNGIKGEGSVTAAMKELTSNRHHNVYIHKVGGEDVNLDKDDMTVDKFIDMAGQFANEISGHPASCKALLAPYSELPALNSKPLASTMWRADRIAELMDLYLEYRDALADVAYLNANRVEFVFPEVDRQDLVDVRRRLESKQKEIMAAVNKLAFDEGAESEPPTHIPPPQDLMNHLPNRRERLPRSARDIHKMYPAAPDGYYDLYIGGKLTGHVVLFCNDMKGAPAEYVTLHSPNNFSVWPASSSEGQRWRHGKTIKTTYKKIRIDADSGLVDLQDRTFAETEGGPIVDTGPNGHVGEKWTAADYATATASNHEEDRDRQPRTPFSTAKIDVSGTGLRLADGVVWRSSGWDVKGGGEKKPDPSNMHQMTVTVGGAPGWYAPVSLQLVPDNS